LKRDSRNVKRHELEKEGRLERRKGLSHCRRGYRVNGQIKEEKQLEYNDTIILSALI